MKRPAFLDRLTSALVGGLKHGGIVATVASEPIATTKLHRVTVVAPKFKALRPFERQDLVWRIAEQTLTPDEQLRISTILTLTPREAAGN